MTERRETSLSRWSRRKRAARGAGRGSAAPSVAEKPKELRPVAEADDAGPVVDEKALLEVAGDEGALPDIATPEGDPDDVAALTAEHGLPDIESLGKESDYTQFLAKDVPAVVTRAALRKLWRSDPIFANLDKLNDYDEDFRVAEGVVEAVRTSYQVGKGYIDADADVDADVDVDVDAGQEIAPTDDGGDAEEVVATESADVELTDNEIAESDGDSAEELGSKEESKSV